MLYELYLTLIILSFILFTSSLFITKLLSKTILLGFALILFAALAAASANVEVIHCKSYVNSSVDNGATTNYVTVSQCNNNSFYYEENTWFFAMFSLICGILFMVNSFQSFKILRGYRGYGGEDE